MRDMYDMLRHMCPPLGLGRRCPARVAYKVSRPPGPSESRGGYSCGGAGGGVGGGVLASCGIFDVVAVRCRCAVVVCWL